MQSVFQCYTVSDKTNRTVIEMWILPFYFYSTFPWARETIKSNVKLNTSIKMYPTLQSHLNTTCECRYWSGMAFAFTYYVATCILVIFYSFNVFGSNKHIFMTFNCNTTYSVSFNKAYAPHYSCPNFLPLKRLTPIICCI